MLRYTINWVNFKLGDNKGSNVLRMCKCLSNIIVAFCWQGKSWVLADRRRGTATAREDLHGGVSAWLGDAHPVVSSCVRSGDRQPEGRAGTSQWWTAWRETSQHGVQTRGYFFTLLVSVFKIFSSCDTMPQSGRSTGVAIFLADAVPPTGNNNNNHATDGLLWSSQLSKCKIIGLELLICPTP